MVCRIIGLLVFVHCVTGFSCDLGCRLPDCFCEFKSIPNNLQQSLVPQMVAFTFTGSVTKAIRAKISEVFTDSYRNPNGCPVPITLYVLGHYTDICSVHQLYVRGHEIAVQAYNTTWPDGWSKEKWANQVDDFRAELSKTSFVPLDEIRGMRAPMLHPGADRQFSMLEERNFLYDSTLLSHNASFWPHTLYIPWEDCATPKYCPENVYPSQWEIPVVPLMHTSGRTCTFLDECVTTNGMRSHTEILSLLAKNFERQYVASRAPLQVNLRADSLMDSATRTALQRFLDYLTEREDAWIVTNTDTIEWIQFPVTYKNAEVFEPWSCPDRKYNRVCSPINGTGSRVAVFHGILEGFTLIIWQIGFLVAAYIALFINDKKMDGPSNESLDGY